MDQVEIIRRELSFPIQLRNTLFLPSVAVLTRLSTSHCVVKWNRDINTTCAFSNNQLESRDHMLSSEYSALICKNLTQLILKNMYIPNLSLFSQFLDQAWIISLIYAFNTLFFCQNVNSIKMGRVCKLLQSVVSYYGLPWQK